MSRMSESTDAVSLCAMSSNMSRSVANSGMAPPSADSQQQAAEKHFPQYYPKCILQHPWRQAFPRLREAVAIGRQPAILGSGLNWCARTAITAITSPGGGV